MKSQVSTQAALGGLEKCGIPAPPFLEPVLLFDRCVHALFIIKRTLAHLTSKELTCGVRLEIDCHPFAGEISRACISYLKLSGSRASRRPCAVSACGYIKNPTGPLLAPGRATSCAKL